MSPGPELHVEPQIGIVRQLVEQVERRDVLGFEAARVREALSPNGCKGREYNTDIWPS